MNGYTNVLKETEKALVAGQNEKEGAGISHTANWSVVFVRVY